MSAARAPQTAVAIDLGATGLSEWPARTFYYRPRKPASSGRRVLSSLTGQRREGLLPLKREFWSARRNFTSPGGA